MGRNVPVTVVAKSSFFFSWYMRFAGVILFHNRVTLLPLYNNITEMGKSTHRTRTTNSKTMVGISVKNFNVIKKLLIIEEFI